MQCFPNGKALDFSCSFIAFGFFSWVLAVEVSDIILSKPLHSLLLWIRGLLPLL
jgi:hypothetical protein